MTSGALRILVQNVQNASFKAAEHLYTTLLRIPHPPNALFLQELGACGQLTIDFFLSLGYRVVSSFTCPGRGEGVAILVHSSTVIATPISGASSDEQLEVCAAYASLFYGPEAPIIGVASLYYPPPSSYQPSDKPLSLSERLLHLSDAGVDMVGADTNTWHPSWGTALTCSSSSNASRGQQVYSFVLAPARLDSRETARKSSTVAAKL